MFLLLIAELKKEKQDENQGYFQNVVISLIFSLLYGYGSYVFDFLYMSQGSSACPVVLHSSYGPNRLDHLQIWENIGER
jgi:hypothetical protein